MSNGTPTRPEAASGPASKSHTSDAVLERLMALHPKLIDLSLERVERLLDKMGNPKAALPPVVHVAGTNGKGSTVAFMRACLEAAGHSVHAYTSPHLVRFHERIRLAGSLIEEDRLLALLEECEAANDGEPITFFEITTVAAFLAFSRTPADVLLLETGLGGRLDTTNVVKRPAVTVITPISHDHHQFLGDNLAGIAREKAGILKPGIVCVTSRQVPVAMEVITARAQDIGVALYREGEDWSVTGTTDGLIYESPSGTTHLPLPTLIGEHQTANAGLALAALERLRGFTIDETALATGLRDAQWPGRLQRLTRGPLVDSLPDGSELWLDGGHNGAAADAIARQAARWSEEDGKPLHLVFGMLNSRKPADFLTPLVSDATSLRAVTIPSEVNALPAETLASAAGDAGFNATAVSDVEQAVRDIVVEATGPTRILICGSLYLAGTVLAENG